MSAKIWQTMQQYGWLVLLSGALLIALVVMSQILQNASSFADTYSALLLFTFGGVTVLLIVLIRAFYRLRVQYKKRTPGIKITLRLTLILTFLLGIPTAIIFVFSLTFIQQGINQWFDVKTETALENASALARAALDNKTRDSLNLTISASTDNRFLLASSPIIGVSALRASLNAQEVSLYHANQQLVAFSSRDGSTILPEKPGDNLFQQVRQKKSYAAIESRQESFQSEEFIRIIIPFTDLDINSHYALQVIFPIPANFTQLAESVAMASGQYKELSYLKGPLTASFTLILSMVLLLTLVTAVLFAIQLIQNFTRPIRTLAIGTKAVSKGDYSLKMAVGKNDEFGDLIQSFNDMTQRIAQARNDIKIGHQQTEVQKLYLQAIIQNLSSGVLTLDMNQRIRTTNDAAADILSTNLNQYTGKHIEEVMTHADSAHLIPLYEAVAPLFNRSEKPWSLQHSLSCKKGQKILLLHGSTLPSIDKEIGGYVIVIDDITELVQAQLNVAWSDVARRLAHEIKNPLTPIQLSAERLNFKLHSKLQADDQALLERMTQTITDQVASMQTLVQAFSDYANTPQMTLQPLNLNRLITDIVEMYQDPEEKWSVKKKLDKKCTHITADAVRLRQLFHNLIKNALEATENTILPQVMITTACQIEQKIVTITVCDNGPGIADDAQNWIFEPYATDKPKGSGLGLAIVRKIVEEHGGTVTLNSEILHGTCFIIHLPISPNESSESDVFIKANKSSTLNQPNETP
jgi:PAS domain S-box-containing protein